MELMRYYKHLRDLNPKAKIENLLFCEKVRGCSEFCLCPLALIKDPWIKSKFPIKSDTQIQGDMLIMINKYKLLVKSKRRNTAKEVETRRKFVEELNKVFYI